MMLAKDLKRIVNQIPDDMPVTLGGNWDCNIEGLSIQAGDWTADLKISERYCIVLKEFV